MRDGIKRRIVFALTMGIVTTGIVSFTIVSINFGFTKTLLPTWFRSWLVAFLIVVPVLLTVSPLIGRLVDYVLHEAPSGED